MDVVNPSEYGVWFSTQILLVSAQSYSAVSLDIVSRSCTDDLPGYLSSSSIRPSPFAQLVSAKPLLDGWYGEHLTCFMPFALQNCSNSSLVKQLPLSETMVIGSPSTANVCRSFVIVALVVADETTCASMYLL